MNQFLFTLFNGPANPSPAMLFAARFLADWVLYVVAAGLVIGWLRAGVDGRRGLVTLGLATLLALAANFTIAALWYHPRPFELGIGHQLIAHAPETSFPSDHATILFAVALSLLAFTQARFWAWLAVAGALGVAWARVWLGIHWPFDMIGSAAVASVAIWIAAWTRKALVATRLTHVTLIANDRILDLLRVPERWAPRSETREGARRRSI